MKHLRSLYDVDPDDVESIFRLAEDLKSRQAQGERPALLPGRVVTQVFEKPSLRTRVSFEAAAARLGGASLFLTAKEAGLNGREALEDVARVLGRYSDVIVLRTFSQALIELFADHARCPVVNGLSDERHPCQALSDLFTVRELFGELKGRRLLFVGDGNNVARSLAVACAICGCTLTVASPPGYELPAGFLQELRKRYPDAAVHQVTDPHEALASADIVYTDVWASMGQEAEAEQRRRIFAPYQVNAELMAEAPAECRFMHCLPARRGMEVTSDVLDGPQSVVFDQAENRMHVAMALLVWLLSDD